MGKNLFLIRHAKAVEIEHGQRDFDRPLKNSGIVDASQIGQYLKANKRQPDTIISSPALRTLQTSQILAEQLSFDTEQIVKEPEIYEASVRTLMNVIKEIDDIHHTVYIIGHNPAITYLAEYLTKQEIGNVPTTGVVQIKLQHSAWQEIVDDCALVSFFTPKSIQ